MLLAWLDDWRADLPLLRASLREEERARAERLMVADGRARFVIGRALLRRELGAEAELVVGEYGKPALAGGGPPYFNVSHSGGLVALAFSDAAPVGVDVEELRVIERWRGIAEREFTPAVAARLTGEASFLREWTRHEARAKVGGAGLSAAAEPGIPVHDLPLPDGLLRRRSRAATGRRWSSRRQDRARARRIPSLMPLSARDRDRVLAMSRPLPPRDRRLCDLVVARGVALDDALRVLAGDGTPVPRRQARGLLLRMARLAGVATPQARSLAG